MKIATITDMNRPGSSFYTFLPGLDWQKLDRCRFATYFMSAGVLQLGD
jgi:hypothetical protein